MSANSKVRVGVDSNIIIYLAKYMCPDYDPDNVVHDLIEKKMLNTRIYKNVPTEGLPLLLQDGFLGATEKLKTGAEIYGNILDIAQLADWVKNGDIELCVCPTVRYELGERRLVADFIEKYATVLKVSNDDLTKFNGMRWALACKYAEAGAIDKEKDAVDMKLRITPDACLTAEYAQFGINFVTANAKHLVHLNVEEEDYIRSERIEQVNKDFGLSFTSTNGMIAASRSMTVAGFTVRLKKHFQGENKRVVDFVDSNIDEDDFYISR